MHVVWTPPATGDLEAIDDHWAAHSEASAEEVAAKNEAAAAFLADLPNAGPPLENGLARKWRVRTTPYLLVYRVVQDRIEILRVYHERMNWRDTA
ncbi:MAG: type II toxin-antitoxin system RelE/ParE family toxin [Sphingomonas sp.]